MRTLYEIDAELLACEYLDEETGEIIDIEKLEALEMEREAKIESVILWRKDILAEYEAVKAEYQNLKKRADGLNKKAESLKGYITNALAGEKFKTARCSVSYTKRASIEIDDINLVDPCFWKPINEDWISKIAIKAALKDGKTVAGAHEELKQSIVIK